MNTLTRSEAARRNGAKSRGPVTSAGKARSSQNARKHGLFSKSFALPTIHHPDFQPTLQRYAESLPNIGPTRLRHLALLDLRIRHCRSLEKSLFDNAAAEAAAARPDTHPRFIQAIACQSIASALDRLSRIESQLLRSYTGALERTRQLTQNEHLS
jgi:hypothetical protein